jgi:hypothetical protein
LATHVSLSLSLFPLSLCYFFELTPSLTFLYVRLEKGFGAHGHQYSLHFQNFEKFKISYFDVSKNYEVKNIDRYIYIGVYAKKSC